MTIREQKDRASGKDYVSPTELALLVGCDPETIRRYVRRGQLPSLHIGGRIRLHRETALRLWARPDDATEYDAMRRTATEPAEA